MNLDNIDIQILEENFDQDLINKINKKNVYEIMNYLLKNEVYFAKDIFLSSLDLFILNVKEFEIKFENLKKILGSNYIEKLENDFSLIEIMYE